MSDLINKKCVPCEGEVEPFNTEQIENYLNEVSGWEVVDSKKISKEFIFKNFNEALDFANKVGAIAEAEQHHPDIHIVSYKKVVVDLSTHAIGGLSENDFIVAAKIDGLIGAV